MIDTSDSEPDLERAVDSDQIELQQKEISKFKVVFLRLNITYFFYGELNSRYLERNALSYFDVLIAIKLH